MNLEEKLVKKLLEKNYTVTTAESCTGGLLAGRILNVSGASGVYNEGHITYSNEAKERLSCSYDGGDMEIGFNSRFFQEMLGNLSQQEILLEMSAPNRAGIITPVDNQNADEDILMLLMPVMLN